MLAKNGQAAGNGVDVLLVVTDGVRRIGLQLPDGHGERAELLGDVR